MPEISERGERVPFSPFRKLAPYAESAKAQGIHVYHLNIGQPDIETPSYALNAVKEFDGKILPYCPSLGNPGYKKKLVNYYDKFGIEITPDQMIVTNGGSEALGFVFQVCLNPGEKVIIPEPFYANYSGFAHMAEVRVRPLTCRIEDGFALPSIEAFESMITEKTRAIVLTNPNNPTGAFYDERMLTKLFLLAQKYDLYLVVDEVYREFCFDNKSFFSALCLKGAQDNIIVVDSVSKRYSATGARVGAILTRNQRVLESVTRYATLRLSPPFLGQLVAEAVLDGEAEQYVEKVRQEYDRRRQLVYRRLAAMEGVVSYLPGGAFYCFARVPIDDCNRFCQWLLEEFRYRGQTVMLAMGDAFYATPGLGKNEVRIAYVLNCQDLDRAMDCLEEALKTYPGRTMPTERLAVVRTGKTNRHP